MTDVDIHAALKFTGGELNYPELRGIPTARIDTHSQRGADKTPSPSRGTPADKSRRWVGGKVTFKECISNQLSYFAKGMSMSMKTIFNFVNIEGGCTMTPQKVW